MAMPSGPVAESTFSSWRILNKCERRTRTNVRAEAGKRGNDSVKSFTHSGGREAFLEKQSARWSAFSWAVRAQLPSGRQSDCTWLRCCCVYTPFKTVQLVFWLGDQGSVQTGS